MSYIEETLYVPGMREDIEVWIWCDRGCPECGRGITLQQYEDSPQVNEFQKIAREHGNMEGHVAHFQLKRDGAYTTTLYP